MLNFKKNKIRKSLYIWYKKGLAKKQLKKIDCFKESRDELINELKYFPESILDLINIGQPNRISGVVNLINAELEMRSMINGTEKTVYTIGRAKQIFGYDKINEQL